MKRRKKTEGQPRSMRSKLTTVANITVADNPGINIEPENRGKKRIADNRGKNGGVPIPTIFGYKFRRYHELFSGFVYVLW